MRVKVLLILFLATAPGLTCGQSAYNPLTNKNSEDSKGGIIKFSVFPFAYAALFKDEYLWLGFHYEKQLGLPKKTFQLTVDYTNYTYFQKLNGVTSYSVPNNVEVWILPQLRHYFKGHPYTGYYIGAFPAYLYRDRPADPRSGTYLGLGTIGGRQFKLKGRFQLELAIRLSVQGGTTSTRDLNGRMVKQTDVFPWLAGEVNVGFGTKRKR